jgi:23S rRNA A1618 N6-methylase RlmF
MRGQFHETTWQAFWLTSDDGQGTTISALMQDPESVPPLERKPNELRQWDVATGEFPWSEKVAENVDSSTFDNAELVHVALRDLSVDHRRPPRHLNQTNSRSSRRP